MSSRRVETKLSSFDLMASMIRGKEQVLLSYCPYEYQVQAFKISLVSRRLGSVDLTLGL